MKITRRQLKRIIQEEVSRLEEEPAPRVDEQESLLEKQPWWPELERILIQADIIRDET